MPLKKGLAGAFVFRKAIKSKAIKTMLRFIMSEENLTYATVGGWIKRIGELTGFKFNTIPYNLRYNAAFEFDKSGVYL